MDQKIIILALIISLFSFIFIMSMYNYSEGLTQRQKKRRAKGAIVRENNNIMNQLTVIGNLIYNTLNPTKPRRITNIHSIASSNKRSSKSLKRTPIKKGKISTKHKSEAKPSTTNKSKAKPSTTNKSKAKPSTTSKSKAKPSTTSKSKAKPSTKTKSRRI